MLSTSIYFWIPKPVTSGLMASDALDGRSESVGFVEDENRPAVAVTEECVVAD